MLRTQFTETHKIGIAYAILTTVLFVFPPELPVTGSNMNYCIAAFAIVLIISVFQWIIDGRKNFKGPYIDESVFRAGSIGDMPIEVQIVGDSPVEEEKLEEKMEEEDGKSAA